MADDKKHGTGDLVLTVIHAYLTKLGETKDERTGVIVKTQGMLRDAEAAHGQDITEWPKKERMLVLSALKSLVHLVSETGFILTMMEIGRMAQDAQLEQMLEAPPAGNA